MNWHRMTAQLPHHQGGLGLTPQRASGIAAFYSASSTFLSWLAPLISRHPYWGKTWSPP